MVICPNCKTENEDGSKFCINCSSGLSSSDSGRVGSAVSTTSSAIAPAQAKNPIASLLLSLLLAGGAGQIYNGQVIKGIAIIAGYFLLSWTCLVPLALSVYGGLDAYAQAFKINEGKTLGDWEFSTIDDIKAVFAKK